jgi:hypothetical protein
MMSSFIRANLKPSPQGDTSFLAMRPPLRSRIEIWTRQTTEATYLQKSLNRAGDHSVAHQVLNVAVAKIDLPAYHGRCWRGRSPRRAAACEVCLEAQLGLHASTLYHAKGLIGGGSTRHGRPSALAAVKQISILHSGFPNRTPINYLDRSTLADWVGHAAFHLRSLH